MTSAPSRATTTDERVVAAQIDAVFDYVVVGVTAAAIASVVLVFALGWFGLVDLRRGAIWSAYITGCAIAHIGLLRAYRRSPGRAVGRRGWAIPFTAIGFAEGVGWGWSPLGLAPAGRSDVQLLILLVSLAVGEGSMVTFGPYLPAFFALFLPASVPFTISALLSDDPLLRVTGILMFVYIGGLSALAVATNGAFNQLVRLRIRTEELAESLQAQKDIAERQREIAEEANRAKSSFLAAASHDLRQPVHALGIFVGALRGVALPPEAERIVEKIETSTAAIDGLFSGLLDISRLDAGVIPVNPSPFAIGPALARVCNDYREEADAKGLDLRLAPCGAVVMSDPVLIERILRNLVSNAVRYTDRGKILIGCRRRGANLALQVADTGRGIPAVDHGRVFQEYFQLGNPERDRTKGLGLGLAIVRRLSDLIGCRLTLRSEPGRGSLFELVVPLAGAQSLGAGVAPAPAPSALARGLVVVIDDEEPIREATLTLLGGWGHEVIAAGSGDEAMERLANCPSKPDLLICDYRLRGGENGVAVVERLRAEYNAAIPAILITGDTAPDRLREAEASGLVLMHKPVSNTRLRAAIANLMAQAAKSADDTEW